MRMPQAEEAVQLSPQRLVGPVSIPRGETHCGLLISPPELELLLRYQSWCGPEGWGFVAMGAVAALKHCAVKPFGKTFDIRSQKTGFKLKRASLLSESVGHKAGRGRPQDHEGNLAPGRHSGDKSQRARCSRLCSVTAYSCIAASKSQNVLTA